MTALTESGKRDERIVHVLNRTRTAAIDEIGFKLVELRGDGQLELVAGLVRITLDTNYVHGEGRLILMIVKGVRNQQRRVVTISGRGTVGDEARMALSSLTNIVNRALRGQGWRTGV